MAVHVGESSVCMSSARRSRVVSTETMGLAANTGSAHSAVPCRKRCWAVPCGHRSRENLKAAETTC